MSVKTGWTRVAFGDVVQLVRERTSDPEGDGFERYVGLEHIEPGDLRIRRWGHVANGTTFTNVFRAGQVLFGKRRAYQRKVAVADFDGICSGDIYVFEPKGDGLLPELLPFICQSDRFFDHAVGTSAGSLSPRTNWDSLARFEFALPPLVEQSRLSNALGRWRGCADAWRAAAAAAMAARDALRRQLFDDAAETVPLEDCISFLTSGSRGWSRFYATQGDLFLRVGNLNSPTIALNLRDVQRVVAPVDAEAQRTQVREGDVLLGITGEAGLGLVALASGIEERAFISQHIAMIRPLEFRFDGRFIAHALAGPGGQRQVAFFNQATAKAGMTLLDVRRLRVPNLPLADQRRRADLLEDAEKALAAIDRRSSLAARGLALQLGELSAQ